MRLDLRQSKRQVVKIETPTVRGNNGLTRFALTTILSCVKGVQSQFIYSPSDTPVTASGGLFFSTMLTEPQIKRVVSFVDGQNLFYAAKNAFGYNHPTTTSRPSPPPSAKSSIGNSTKYASTPDIRRER